MDYSDTGSYPVHNEQFDTSIKIYLNTCLKNVIPGINV